MDLQPSEAGSHPALRPVPADIDEKPPILLLLEIGTFELFPTDVGGYEADVPFPVVLARFGAVFRLEERLYIGHPVETLWNVDEDDAQNVGKELHALR